MGWRTSISFTISFTLSPLNPRPQGLTGRHCPAGASPWALPLCRLSSSSWAALSCRTAPTLCWSAASSSRSASIVLGQWMLFLPGSPSSLLKFGHHKQQVGFNCLGPVKLDPARQPQFSAEVWPPQAAGRLQWSWPVNVFLARQPQFSAEVWPPQAAGRLSLFWPVNVFPARQPQFSAQVLTTTSSRSVSLICPAWELGCWWLPNMPLRLLLEYALHALPSSLALVWLQALQGCRRCCKQQGRC